VTEQIAGCAAEAIYTVVHQDQHRGKIGRRQQVEPMMHWEQAKYRLEKTEKALQMTKK
jgi:hypothetical protein